MALRANNRLAKTLMQQRAVGETSQVVMVCKVVDVIGSAAMLRNIAAGNGQAVSEPHNLNIEPSAFDHLVVDKNFTFVGNARPDDLAIFMDEARLDHEWPNFRQDFAVKRFAGHAKPTLGVRVNVAEAEINDSTGGIRDAVKDVEVIQGAFRRGEEPGMVRSAGCICRSKTPHTKGV